VTFKIGDILRCKCSSQEGEIRALYSEVERISHQQPHLLRIVRIKDRLEQGTRDILINLMYRDTTLVEMQLAVKGSKSKFIEQASKLGHYLYELERSQFGPVSELCSIWMAKDPRGGFFLDHFRKNNKRKSEEQRKKPEN